MITIPDTVLEELAFESKCRSNYARVRLLRNKATGEIIPLSCKSWRCPKHQKQWLHRWRVILIRELRVNPVDKLITLSCASKATPAQLTLARQLFFEQWRKINGSIEYFSVLEFTSETRLPHLHILARANYFRQREISRLWAMATKSSGIKRSPVVYIEKPKSQEFSGFYALKYALSGTEKGQDIPDDWKGRKVSYSRNFFQSATTKEHWQSYLEETFGSKPDPENWEIIFDVSQFSSGKEYLAFAEKQGIIS